MSNKYVFEIISKIVIHADSLDEAWEDLPEVVRGCASDLDYCEVEQDVQNDSN